MSDYLDATRIRALAHELNLRPSKGRGQNFLFDANTIRRIVGLAEIGPDDHVLEVGPGPGSLTIGLLHSGAQVTAVEIEQSLAERLPVTMGELAPDKVKNLTVIEGDALKMGPGFSDGACAARSRSAQDDEGGCAQADGGANSPTVLVANLPYNISVPVILHLLATFPSIQRGLVLVQLEVADRLAAPPGSKVYGVPSAKLAWYADAARVGTVPATVFWPAPNVESGLVRFVRHECLGLDSNPEAPLSHSAHCDSAQHRLRRIIHSNQMPHGSCDSAQDDEERLTRDDHREAVFTLIDVAFSQRRKMLRSVLASHYPNAAQGLETAGIDPQARGETLSIGDFVRLARALAV